MMHLCLMFVMIFMESDQLRRWKGSNGEKFTDLAFSVSSNLSFFIVFLFLDIAPL